MVRTYEDAFMGLLSSVGEHFFGRFVYQREHYLDGGNMAFGLPFGFCGVVTRCVCSSARHLREWTGFGMWHQPVCHSPRKGHGFYSSSAVYGATCTGELGESFTDALLSEPAV